MDVCQCYLPSTLILKGNCPSPTLCGLGRAVTHSGGGTASLWVAQSVPSWDQCLQDRRVKTDPSPFVPGILKT